MRYCDSILQIRERSTANKDNIDLKNDTVKISNIHFSYDTKIDSTQFFAYYHKNTAY